MRIEIVGAIGVGKTTLARHLSEALGYPVQSEIPELNPFWELAYAGEGDVQFEKDVSFLLSHGVQIRQSCSSDVGLICDFSFYQDLAYARMGQSAADLKVYETVWHRGMDRCGPPDLVVDLHASATTALDRIYGRGRSAEQALSPDFLISLRSHLNEVLSSVAAGQEIVRIETNERTPYEVATETLTRISAIPALAR